MGSRIVTVAALAVFGAGLLVAALLPVRHIPCTVLTEMHCGTEYRIGVRLAILVVAGVAAGIVAIVGRRLQER